MFLGKDLKIRFWIWSISFQMECGFTFKKLKIKIVKYFYIHYKIFILYNNNNIISIRIYFPINM